MPRMTKMLGGREVIEAELPPYEHPPAWIPIEQRKGHHLYDNDLRKYLPRVVKLRRAKPTDALGFNIRGGQEHSCGIYISKVMPTTEAEGLGLQEGDQILMVNDYNFESIDHSQAVKVLKSNTDVQILVRYFPYGYQKTYEKTKMLASLQFIDSHNAHHPSILNRHSHQSPTS